jgi:hypothetical protein
MVTTGLHFVVVPDASQYAATTGCVSCKEWLRRVEFDANRYLSRSFLRDGQSVKC